MSTQHTPGPWSVIDGHYPSFKEISGPSFKINVVMWATDLTEDDYRKRDADLHLIAAAPDLLDALREAEAGLEFAGADKLTEVGGFAPAPLAALRIVRAAIKKATGATN